MKKLIYLITFALASTFTLSSLALANGNISITRAEPDPTSKNNTWFIFEVQPGQSVEDAVLIKNLGTEKVKVRVLSIDSKSNKAGRFILKRSDEQQENLGKWTELESNILELNSLQAIPIKFKITVPKDTEPSEYAGGIIVEEIADPSEKSIVTTRIGNRIYLKVPGHTEQKLIWLAFNSSITKFNILSPFHKTHYFKFALENNGNTLIKPTVTLEAFSFFGNKIANIEKQLGELQPGAIAEPLIKWDDAPLFGHFTVKATIKLAEGPKESQIIVKEIQITVIPWELLIVIALIMTIFIIGFLLCRKKMSNLRKP